MMSGDMAGALVGMLARHGNIGIVCEGEIWGDAHYSRLLERPAVVLPWERRLPVDGTVTGVVWERIGTTVEEVRAWLGY